jgi:flagellar M-ring protein FliF
VDGLIRFINAMGTGRLITLVGLLAGLFFFFYFVVVRISQPPMGMLYGGLELADSSSIIQRLQAMNVPHELRSDGRMIFVPQDQISNLRVTLAGEGLGGSVVGYELFDRSDSLGTTSFVQNINRIRAIEGELARTIAEITSVTSARVHIVMPERQLFSEDSRVATASIILRTRRGGISASQVTAIQYLASSAVPGLDPQRISIVDQNGTLLARSSAADGETSVGTEFEQRRLAVENRFRSQIESLLENTVGAGKVRAEVSVEMNVNRLTLNSQTFDPDTQVILSQATTETTSSDLEGDSNAGVSVAGALPGAADGTGAPQNTSATSSTTETINFQNSSVTSTEIREGGELMRVTVAVLVDGSYSADADGALTVYQPRPQAELDQLATLVQTTIGYDANRGDLVEVINLQFIQAEEGEPVPDDFSVGGLNLDDIGAIGARIFWFITGILAFFMIVRPLIQKLLSAIPEAPPAPVQIAAAASPIGMIPSPEEHGITAELAAAAASGDEDAIRALAVAKESKVQPHKPLGIESQIDVATVEGRVQDSALKRVGDIVIRHPEESTAIVRSWLYSD